MPQRLWGSVTGQLLVGALHVFVVVCPDITVLCCMIGRHMFYFGYQDSSMVAY